MYYKITTQNLQSINEYLHSDDIIQYKLRTTSRPKHEYAPLCVFDNLPDALTFKEKGLFTSHKIFECIIKHSKKDWYRRDLYDCYDFSTTKGKLINIYPWPKGTVLADEVTLIKEVTDKKPKIYYKVVNSFLRSCCNESRWLNLDVIYKIDEWVLPKNKYAPLMVFSNLDAAINFGSFIIGSVFIFKCEIIKSKQEWGYISQSSIINLEAVLKAKKSKKRINKQLFRNQLPQDTIFADAVKLVERVHENTYWI